MKTLRREIVNLIKKNIEIVGGRILAGGKTRYKFVFDADGDVSIMPEGYNTPSGCIGVDKWQYGNGFEIDSTTSDYRLCKVADRIIGEYENDKRLEKEINV